MITNESAWRPENKTRNELLKLWSVMQETVNNGIANKGVLPGGLNVPRRAHKLHKQLTKKSNKKLLFCFFFIRSYFIWCIFKFRRHGFLFTF